MQKLPNGKIKVHANNGKEVYDYEYLVWSGLLKDFDAIQTNIITDESERKLFTDTEEFFMASTIVNMRNDSRKTPTIGYLENEVWPQNNEVIADSDATAYVLVRIHIFSRL